VIIASRNEPRPWGPIGAVTDCLIIYFVALLFASITCLWIPTTILSKAFSIIALDEFSWAQYVVAWTLWFIFLIWLLLVNTLARGVTKEVFLFAAPDLKLRVVAIRTMTVFCLVLVCDAVIYYLVPIPADEYSAMWDYLLHSNFKWIMLFNLLLLGPIFEEVMFRGLLFPTISQTRVGATGGAVLTSLLWSLSHFYALGGSISIFLCGLALCYLRKATGSLWPSLAAHSGLNLVYAIEIINCVSNSAV
jgi:membrane protease YdiL (CAAX protease family)